MFSSRLSSVKIIHVVQSYSGNLLNNKLTDYRQYLRKLRNAVLLRFHGTQKLLPVQTNEMLALNKTPNFMPNPLLHLTEFSPTSLPIVTYSNDTLVQQIGSYALELLHILLNSTIDIILCSASVSVIYETHQLTLVPSCDRIAESDTLLFCCKLDAFLLELSPNIQSSCASKTYQHLQHPQSLY